MYQSSTQKNYIFAFIHNTSMIFVRNETVMTVYLSLKCLEIHLRIELHEYDAFKVRLHR